MSANRWVPGLFLGWALSLLAAAGGCGADETLEADDVTSVTSAITTTDFQDATGTIVIRVKTCDPTPSAFTNCAYCFIEPDWALVGGGGQIAGESTPGAMLQSSFPSRNSFSTVNSYGCTGPAGGDFDKTWVVRASGNNHTLRAYVIGMKIRDTPTSPLFAPFVTWGVDAVTDIVPPPTMAMVETTEQQIFETSGHNTFLIGGGIEIINPSLQIAQASTAFITISEPRNGLNGRSWFVGARSTVASPPLEALKSYGIGIDPCPWANGNCFTYPSIRSIVAAPVDGYSTASYTLPASWVGTSVGGSALTVTGGARFVADLIPFNGSQKGFTVRSKPNNGVMANGGAIGHVLAVGRSQAPYTFNAVRFNLNGTNLYRPSGTTPQLQQTTLAPDQPATRWHLEHLGGGVYRIRNGNPDSGTQCAYRSFGSTVRVNTCGSGNEFKWTALSGTIYTGPFQLRNMANNQCLDNNNQGQVTGNLRLATCSSGSSAQVLFLDAYNWPPL